MWVVFALIAEVFGLGVDGHQLEGLRRRIAELDVSQIRAQADHRRLMAENADLQEIVDYFVREDAKTLN